VGQLAFPPTNAVQLFINLIDGLGKLCFQQCMRYVATGFCGGPAIGLLRAAIPEQDYAVHIVDDDGVMSQLK